MWLLLKTRSGTSFDPDLKQTMKLLVTVIVPAISRQYDVLVPKNIKIRVITPLIAEMVEDLSNHMYVATGQEFLCALEKNTLLRQNETLESYGIQNGDHLVMT